MAETVYNTPWGARTMPDDEVASFRELFGADAITEAPAGTTPVNVAEFTPEVNEATKEQTARDLRNAPANQTFAASNKPKEA